MKCINLIPSTPEGAESGVIIATFARRKIFVQLVIDNHTNSSRRSCNNFPSQPSIDQNNDDSADSDNLDGWGNLE